MYGCDCNLTKAREVQLSQPSINFNGGFGWMGENGCLIDNDTELRKNEEQLTNKRFIHQYPNLLNQGFFGKGVFDVDAETLLTEIIKNIIKKIFFIKEHLVFQHDLLY